MPVKKRKASVLADPSEDPTRKYCLQKLEEVFQQIFLRYPHVQAAEGVSGGDGLVSKHVEQLSDEEREFVIGASKSFAAQLEQAMFDGYAERDRSGNATAAAQYKCVLHFPLRKRLTFSFRDRFRTINFNLSKPDRVAIHKRIASADIAASELSTMSSTDLANEETKLSIKQAEKEALEQTILQQTLFPRTKITHKGLQDIEMDEVHGQFGVVYAMERAQQDKEQREEQERRERERLARLQNAEEQKKIRQRQLSLSIPPESPIAPNMTPATLASDTMWGGPPPLPGHVSEMGDVSAPGEAEMSLTDLINLDDDDSRIGSVPPQSAVSTDGQQKMFASPVDGTFSTPFGEPPSPAQHERQRAPSFDLNALWSQPRKHKDETSAKADGRSASPSPDTAAVHANANGSSAKVDGEEDGDEMELESLEAEAEDKDFDMFLDDRSPSVEKISAAASTTPTAVEDFDIVWNGKVRFPHFLSSY